VDSEAYLLACMRYIELNPIRANMVFHPGEYQWSSFGANAVGRPDSLIQPHPVYQSIGADDEQRRHSYRELFRMHMDHEQIHDIRESLSQELVLGREDFKARIEQMTQRQTRPGKPGRPRVGEVQGIYYVV
jgi:putative transposase